MQRIVPKPLSRVSLADYDPEDTGGMEKEACKEETEKLREKLDSLQERLYAESKQSLLIVLQATDTAGKDSTIRRVLGPVNVQGVDVVSFKAPTPVELAHDFLWRVHPHTPAKGMITVFNRSHYEDVLVPKVNGWVTKKVLDRRYDDINNFEGLLVDNGTSILKFYLYISKDEQKQRLQDRLEDPTKHWKFSSGDLPVREQWDDYIKAYEALFHKCNTEIAPWHIVPANKKWYRDYVVTKAVVDQLEKMDPQYPPPEEGLDKIVIPD